MSNNDGAEFRPAEGPWNPGISSVLTRELQACASIFRPENVLNDLSQAMEVHNATGLELERLAAFRPERLALHEVLVRVTADYEVPDPDSADVQSLGITFRNMVRAVIARAVTPAVRDIVREYDTLRSALASFISAELARTFAARPEPGSQRGHRILCAFQSRLRKALTEHRLSARTTDYDADELRIRQWITCANADKSPMRVAAFRSLLEFAAAIRGKYGRIPPQLTLVGAVVTDLACNDYGGEAIGRLIDPLIREAAKHEGFRELPPQNQPVTMMTKGASASGKSTMRPLQRALAARMGLTWRNFALISPDVWRKILLDFESLGANYKYAGMLTSQELAVVDQKLDAYLVRKGQREQLPHLLIDRFRFDSFAIDSEDRHFVSSFCKLLCYFLMITPPHKTVERAWRRGLEIGRYKAVDDLLDHNVEAFRGMQKILFGRALVPNRGLHYELLDNDVPIGATPFTVAFGWSGEMNVLDVKCMLDVCRYSKINVDANSPNEVYPGGWVLSVQHNVEFLASCIRKFPRLNFADRATGRIYARFAAGRLAWADCELVIRAAADPETQAALRIVSPNLFGGSLARSKSEPEFLRSGNFPTIGQWGWSR